MIDQELLLTTLIACALLTRDDVYFDHDEGLGYCRDIECDDGTYKRTLEVDAASLLDDIKTWLEERR